jgi:hypothetical protein
MVSAVRRAAIPDTTRTGVVRRHKARGCYWFGRGAGRSRADWSAPTSPHKTPIAPRGHHWPAGRRRRFFHRGHGIGLEVREPPYIIEGNWDVLTPGMTQWSRAKSPREVGSRRVDRDIVAVTADGVERLNGPARAPTVD